MVQNLMRTYAKVRKIISPNHHNITEKFAFDFFVFLANYLGQIKLHVFQKIMAWQAFHFFHWISTPHPPPCRSAGGIFHFYSAKLKLMLNGHYKL